jgi:hypothetical protein
MTALQGPNFPAWCDQSEEEDRKLVGKIIRELLIKKLQHTGVDRNKRLMVSWMIDNDARRCFVIKCKGGNLRAQILTDSDSIATFACITASCLESPCRTSHQFQALSTMQSCQANPAQPFQLCTQVRPFLREYTEAMISRQRKLELICEKVTLDRKKGLEVASTRYGKFKCD